MRIAIQTLFAVVCLALGCAAFARPAALQKAVSFAPKPMTKVERDSAKSDADFLLKALPDGAEAGKLHVGAFVLRPDSAPQPLIILGFPEDFADANIAESGGVKLSVRSDFSGDSPARFVRLDAFVRSISDGRRCDRDRARVQVPDGRFALRVFDGDFGHDVFKVGGGGSILWILFRP